MRNYKWYVEQEEEKVKERGQSHSPKKRDTECRSAIAETQILGIVETITGKFGGGGKSNEAKKGHLRSVMNTKNKK